MIKAVKAIIFSCTVIVAALSSTGCSQLTVLRVKELNAVRDSIRADQQAYFNKLLEEQSKLLAEQRNASEMLRLLRADQLARFNEMDRKTSAISNNLSDSQSRLSRLDQKTSEFSRRLDQKLASEEDAANQRKAQQDKLFEIAMSDFNAGRYDLSISGFLDFLRQFPDAAQASDAEYWAAESRFAKKEYEAAEKEYMAFIKKYPDGQRSCSVFYKLGLAYEHQDKKKSMEMVWKNLLQRCPDSQEAQSVKARMGQ
ncbi:MAG: tetratricopeptide repeat protein [Chitinispirillales bacterium]|nr:tetratricopeptide repeat protein [Chitinispirillales bacterium]